MKTKSLLLSAAFLFCLSLTVISQPGAVINFYGYDDGGSHDYLVITVNNGLARAMYSGGSEDASNKMFFTGSIIVDKINGTCKSISNGYGDVEETHSEKDQSFKMIFNGDKSKIEVFVPQENTEHAFELSKTMISYGFEGVRNLRQEPNKTAKILSKIDFANSQAKLIEIGNLEKIGEITDFWYKVNANNVIGWIFSGFSLNGIAEDSQATNLYFYLNKGNEKFEQQDYLGSIADFTKAIEFMGDDNGTAFLARGNAKKALNDNTGAMDDYSKAIENSNKSNPGVESSLGYDAYYKRGSIKKTLKDYNGAIADFTLAIQNYPQSADAYFARGFSKVMLNDKRGANADFTKAIENNPDFPEAYLNRGLTWINIENVSYIKNACLDFRKAKALGMQQADDLIRQYCNN